jgi:hypothetical protein
MTQGFPGDDYYYYEVHHINDGTSWEIDRKLSGLSGVDLVWSPDSKQIAYIDQSNIVVYDANGDNRHEIGYCGWGCSDLIWSPSSQHLYYLGSISSDQNALKRIDKDGRLDAVVASCLSLCTWAKWMPDQQLIAYGAYGTEGNLTQYYDVNLDRHVSPFLLDPLRINKFLNQTNRASHADQSPSGLYSTRRISYGSSPHGFHIIDNRTGKVVRDITFSTFYKSPLDTTLSRLLISIVLLVGAARVTYQLNQSRLRKKRPDIQVKPIL